MAVAENPSLPRIQPLPDFLTNQIAAGEVIERPASVIKELLENSFDARATRIDIDILKGGIQQIRITDNGHGIHPQDVQLALQRHATSKIKSQADLERITSLGFRGEALPSIASIAQFKIISRITGADQAWSLIHDPLTGAMDFSPAAHPPGTTVEVKNLFHAVPARRKFLRSERTEFLHSLETIRHLALGCLDTDIHLSHNGKTILHCRAVSEDCRERLQTVVGKSFVKKAKMLDYTSDTMRLWGWIGTAELSRSQSDKQYFYLNGRMIRDKRVNHAIRLAYENEIPPGRYPAYVLYLELDAAAADVNVHPTKHEVRFRHARDVHDFIYANLRDSLRQTIPLQTRAQADRADSIPAHNPDTGFWSAQQHINESAASYFRAAVQSTGDDNDTPSTALGKPITQLGARFIITERNKGEYVLLDVQAAKKQIARRRLQQSYQQGCVRQRPLLVPVSLPAAQAWLNVIEQHAAQLDKMGLQLEAASPTSMLVRSLPVALQDADIQSLLQDVLELMLGMEQLNDKLCGQLFAVMADHACDTEADNMTVADMTALIHALESAGMDLAKDKQAGIWRVITPGDLAELIGK